MNYPKWSDISGLVAKLKKRKHPDCIAAAENLEELHSRLHNTTGELETSQERIAKLGYMIEEAAAKAELQREGVTVRAFTIPFRGLVHVAWLLPTPTRRTAALPGTEVAAGGRWNRRRDP